MTYRGARAWNSSRPPSPGDCGLRSRRPRRPRRRGPGSCWAASWPARAPALANKNIQWQELGTWPPCHKGLQPWETMVIPQIYIIVPPLKIYHYVALYQTNSGKETWYSHLNSTVTLILYGGGSVQITKGRSVAKVDAWWCLAGTHNGHIQDCSVSGEVCEGVIMGSLEVIDMNLDNTLFFDQSFCFK